MSKHYGDAGAQNALRELLIPGQTIYTTLRSVASNGMSRHIEVMIATLDRDGRPQLRNITRLVARACDFKLSSKTEALVIGGCGMDMGFHVVYSIGRALFPEGVKCTGSNGYRENPSAANGYEGKPSKALACRSNAHMNDRSIPYSRRVTHSDAGYTFGHSWA